MLVSMCLESLSTVALSSERSRTASVTSARLIIGDSTALVFVGFSVFHLLAARYAAMSCTSSGLAMRASIVFCSLFVLFLRRLVFCASAIV